MLLGDRLAQLGGVCMSLLDDEHILEETIDKELEKRLEFEKQLKESIQRFADSVNMSSEKRQEMQDFTKWLTLYTKIPI